MTEQMIVCPKCKKKFPLTEAMTQQIEGKLRVEMETEWSKKEEKLRKEQEKHERELKFKYDADLEEEKGKLTEKLTKKIRNDVKEEITEKDEKLEDLNKKVSAYRKREKALSKRELELQDKEHNMEIEKNEAIKHASEKAWKEAREKADKEYALKEADKNKKIEEMTKQIVDLQRKLEQGPSQRQGEVQEQRLEDMLRDIFATDKVEPIAPGKKGGDILQTVNNDRGRPCGSILWESKRTKSWSEGWLDKIKADQRNCKADIAVIVSEALPSGIGKFGYKDGVWVCDMQSAIGVATALRINLQQIYQARAVVEGMTEKRDLVYKYLTGNEFRQRIEAMVEAFRSMQDDLNRERTAMERSWATREKQISTITQNLAGIFGDLMGFGAQLQPVKMLELPGDVVQLSNGN